MNGNSTEALRARAYARYGTQPGICKTPGCNNPRIPLTRKGNFAAGHCEEHVASAGKDANLWKNYRIRLADYERMFEEQGGLCAICGRPPKDGMPLYVDHDHNHCPGAKACGLCIRGLLCDSCNKALGLFQDDPDILDRASEYLKEYR